MACCDFSEGEPLVTCEHFIDKEEYVSEPIQKTKAKKRVKKK